jgi:C-terminal processing protease CtpA/Prc
MMRVLNENQIPGLIIDMRQNGGGSGFLADQMAAYFFNEPYVLGNAGFYDEDHGEFYFDPRTEDRFYLPAEELRYNGDVAVLVGPNCASACEFFSYDMTIADRAAIVGQYPTAGLGGSIDEVLMPEGEAFRFTQGRAVDNDGIIHIEGIGVVPTVQVPVNEDTLFSVSDPVLQAAIDYLDNQ